MCDSRLECTVDPIFFQLKIWETQWESRTYFKPNLSANGKNPISSLANGIYALARVWFTRPRVITPNTLAPSSLEDLRHRVSHAAHSEGKESGYNSEDCEFHGLFWSLLKSASIMKKEGVPHQLGIGSLLGTFKNALPSAFYLPKNNLW